MQATPSLRKSTEAFMYLVKQHLVDYDSDNNDILNIALLKNRHPDDETSKKDSQSC